MRHLILSLLLLASCQAGPEPVILKAGNHPLHEINEMIFGQFLEKCNWGNEIGADVMWDQTTGSLNREVVEIMRSFDLPVVRFPGGSDVDHYPWTELIDHVPGRVGGRPAYDGRNGNVVSQNEVGLDEFLDLSEELGFEPLLVVNIGDALLDRSEVASAARTAAAMVGYCNAPLDADLPGELKIWPQIRAENGHPEPWKVRYFQLGNEVWLLNRPRFKRTDTELPPGFLEKYYGIVQAFIGEMKSVDADIRIILEGNNLALANAADEFVEEEYEMLAFHRYAPWAMNAAIGPSGSDTLISQEEFWLACMGLPSIDGSNGQAVFQDPVFLNLSRLDKQIAVTEWNWNGWLAGNLKKTGLRQSDLVQGLGAASFLHAMMRGGEWIQMGCQSMLVGQSWGITGIRVDSLSGEVFSLPTAQATAFYGRNHGSQLLESQLQNNRFYAQPYTLAGIKACEKVAFIDAVVTRDKTQLYFHIINRHLDESIPLEIRFEGLSGAYQHLELNGSLEGSVQEGDHEDRTQARVLSNDGLIRATGRINLTLNPHSMNIIITSKSS